MKKCLILLPIFALCLLVGCSKKNNDTTTGQRITTNEPVTTKEGHVHAFGDWILIYDSTCSKPGLRQRTCSCGEVEDDEIGLKSHEYVNDVCKNCGAEKLSDGFTIEYDSTRMEYVVKNYLGTSTNVLFTRKYNDGRNGEHSLTVRRTMTAGVPTCCLENTNIKTIRLGKDFATSDRGIDEGMFAGMKNLEEIVLPDGLTTINEQAFRNCSKLSKITYNNSLTTIGHYAFDGCGFTKLTFPSTLKNIDVNAFSNNSSLNEITLNQGLEEVYSNAFDNSIITTIQIPSSLKLFEYQENLSKLETITINGSNDCFRVENNCLIYQYEEDDNTVSSVVLSSKNSTIPTTVDEIGMYAFANHDYSGVATFTVPSNVKYISSYAFSGTKFNDIEILGVEYIGLNVFYDATFSNYQTKTLVLPNTLIGINDFAFQGLQMNEVTIPKSVTKVGESILANSSVTNVNIYQSTLDSPNLSMYWNSGYSPKTITILDE